MKRKTKLRDYVIKAFVIYCILLQDVVENNFLMTAKEAEFSCLYLQQHGNLKLKFSTKNFNFNIHSFKFSVHYSFTVKIIRTIISIIYSFINIATKAYFNSVNIRIIWYGFFYYKNIFINPQLNCNKAKTF